MFQAAGKIVPGETISVPSASVLGGRRNGVESKRHGRMQQKEEGSRMSPVMPFVIPIVFLLGAFAVGIVAMILNNRTKERRHRERMFLAEKGMDIPPELYEVQKQEIKENGYKSGRIWLTIMGLLCIFIGLSVIIMLLIRGEPHNATGGIVPIGIGIAFLVSERVVARMAAREKQ
jgi:hypothetical protein